MICWYKSVLLFIQKSLHIRDRRLSKSISTGWCHKVFFWISCVFGNFVQREQLIHFGIFCAIFSKLFAQTFPTIIKGAQASYFQCSRIIFIVIAKNDSKGYFLHSLNFHSFFFRNWTVPYYRWCFKNRSNIQYIICWPFPLLVDQTEIDCAKSSFSCKLFSQYFLCLSSRLVCY